ncbi:MAG: hypothetical protein WDN49_06110 [Acetobacteraceae bacterium]
MALHWQRGAAAVLTVQVPNPRLSAGDGTRLERVVAVLHETPDIAAVRVLSDDELADLLRPWLGGAAQAMSLPLPAVIEVRLAPGEADPDPALRLGCPRRRPGPSWRTKGCGCSG